jgi:hypothetical protein
LQLVAAEIGNANAVEENSQVNDEGQMFRLTDGSGTSSLD